MQKGRIELRGNTWLLRYNEVVLIDGKPVRKSKAKKLATFGHQYRTEASVRPIADEILAPINAKSSRPTSAQRVDDFLEHVYLVEVEKTLKPSTQKAYLDFFKLVKPHLHDRVLRDVRTSDIDKIMRDVAATQLRAHTTFRNVKSFLSGAFRYAKRMDLIEQNPVRDSVVPRGKPAGVTYAYSLDEILTMIDTLTEPLRTAVIVAAFTGLRSSEIKGLKWEDFKGDELHVSRGVWDGHITETKTLYSKAPVPVVPILAKALAEHRKRSVGNEFIFAGSTGQPLRLENVVARYREKNDIDWHGWHAFRRGIGTNLHQLGVPTKTIQAILRHSDISTTEAFYVKPVASESVKAMKKLQKAYDRLSK